MRVFVLPSFFLEGVGFGNPGADTELACAWDASTNVAVVLPMQVAGVSNFSFPDVCLGLLL